MDDRAARLRQIQEAGFAVDDLTLYLDTHPLDTDALEAFTQAKKKRYQLMEDFAKKYEPLNPYLVCPDTNNETKSHTKYPGQKHFTWCDGPLPWDAQGGA